ncbi:murein biosynthesis integral membrane protein MurJ [Sulfuriroseicoccus oceanibius]|uniref:Probable lipid II flippase MurJ n=1 Tax=Sulfuriroseicoccus oceanibius TaxID=2707525 RepID=A0A6B3LBR1_9BACT|nr:murein biosynthesis integral membrane protein MurJ [Sulfuriroseicoccus oceanibius]QQL45061.1 murein biosynthesis integral membrane protein MurJ [Sulfuriroseicoccus oceanibius]
MSEAAAKPAAAKSGLRSTWVVSAAIMFSRVLGLAREMLLFALFETRWLSCFYLAFKIPNLLRDLFAEGALSQAFVTVFSKKMKDGGDKPAWVLAHKMLTLTSLFMGMVSLVGILAAPWIVDLFIGDGGAEVFDQEMRDLTVLMVRIMYPFIAIVSLAALVMGILNARGVFGIPALASSFFNLGSMATGFGIGYLMDPGFGKTALVGFSIGTVIGGLAQLGVQVPSLWKQGFRMKPDFAWRKDEGVRKILSLLGPAVIASSAVQVNVMINAGFAARSSEGAVALLQGAFRLMQLPLGLFGVAVAMVTLPALSRAAGDANHASGEFRGILSGGVRFVTMLTLPCAVGLALLAEPVISLLYERGKFDHEQVGQMASALRFYAIGLIFYSAIKVIQPAFYAIEKRFIPMIISFISIAINFVSNYLFVIVFNLPFQYLALSTGIVAALNCVQLYVIMARQAGGLETLKLLGSFAKLAVAAGVMSVIGWLGMTYLMDGFSGFPVWKKLITLMPTIALAALGYFGVCFALRVGELAELRAMIARKLAR